MQDITQSLLLLSKSHTILQVSMLIAVVVVCEIDHNDAFSLYTVSGFYCESPSMGFYINASILLKTKFLGFSVGVYNIGTSETCQ